MQGVPLDSVKDVNAARYEELMGINHLIQSFNLFTMSKNVGIKYGPTDQSMAEKVPITGVPPPISMETRPLTLGVGVWVSTYTGVPLSAPCKILILIPT